MLLAKPEEQEVRVDTKRRDERAVKWLREYMISRASGGVSRRRQAKNFCLCWRTEGFQEGRREHRQWKKTFFASLRFKAIAEFLHRERTGRRKKGIPRDKPKLAETSLGLWKGTAVKLRGRRGNQPTRTRGTSLAPSSASAQSQPRSTSQGCQSRFFYYSNNKIEDTSEENTYP